MAKQSVDDVALGTARASSAGVATPKIWVGLVFAFVVFVGAILGGLNASLGVLTTLTAVFFYMTLAQGWNLLGGFGGYLNFASALFMGTGAYLAGWLHNEFGLGLVETIVPAAMAGALVSLVVGYATLRLRSHYFAIFTLILVFLGAVVVRNMPAVGGGAGIFFDMEGDWTSESLARYFFFLFFGLAVFASIIMFLVENSNFGYALRAISEDEAAAQVLGVRTTEVKLWALVIGATLAGAAGAMFGFFTSYIEPAGVFHLDIALDVILIAVIGGLRSWMGPVIGAFIVVFLEQTLRLIIPEITIFGTALPAETGRLILGALLIIFALFFRRGIVGLFQARRGRLVNV